MSNNVSYKVDNKRIAKNSLYLYIRMFFVLIISLFTVRVTLRVLGEEDYGINNVVGGVVTMFTFLTSSLSSASLRFFSFNLGKNDYLQLSKYFTISFWCYAILAFIIFVLSETVGYFLIFKQLTIPEERWIAATFVYQFSIFALLIKLLVVPFNSLIIAHERMDFFAILGIIEVIVKLLVTVLIYISPFDKLISYGILIFIAYTLVDLTYVFYCLKYFKESRIMILWNSNIFKDLFRFSGWTLFGTISDIVRAQGINILLNLYFGPVVNAARAIAYQINSHVNQFVMNFYKAVQPQITKSCGSGDFSNMNLLVYRSSRYCFYLIFLIALPIILEANYILSVWLKDVPEYTVVFTRLVILAAIIDSMSYPLNTAIQATGNIKYFQLVTGSFLMLSLPLSWMFLRIGFPPETTMYVGIFISVCAQFLRIYFSIRIAKLSISDYFRNVLQRILFSILCSVIVPTIIVLIMEDSILRFLIVVSSSIIFSFMSFWLVGISDQEKQVFSSIIKQKIYAPVNKRIFAK